MTVETKLALTEQDVRSYSVAKQEPNWFAEYRIRALGAAENLPLPSPDKTKIDKWNFTDFPVHSVESATFSSLAELPEEVKSIVTEGQQSVYIQRNNTPAFIQVSDELKSKGVIFTDIQTAIRDHEDLVKKYFMTNGVKVDEHKLTSLNAALLNGGVFVYVPKNVVLEEPLQAVFMLDDTQTSLFNHTIVVADTNSSVTYVENYLSTVENATGIVNIISEVFAEDNASVTYGAVDV